MLVMIACSRPGYVRGGVRHPEFATYFAGYFKAKQLHEMIGDRHLQVCVGRPLTADSVDDFIAQITPPATNGLSAEAAEGKAASADAGQKYPGAARAENGAPETEAATANAASSTTAGGKPRATRRRK